ncbi:glycosyltransferase family 4 protein [Eoetvoesiella caeni]|uniref:Glycosyltransferase involved in cell wall biosynthesis n=1 Tax=Eoetvoesiella caeni TaxID=645616 RepID=A0A366H5T3_9BURK|nr:glycosyltransferase family 4 protein [Eoetvoesiella caeni]MCI2810065.1 glycosyltransferase family 4 protein [Eoetvoesiella caeni]NYT55937.1 glycosyltransferase family 4 protein [Eoetvoesiella caeni]RBP37450.1 glycosyltransferase involved in cell wall biosynthesis [Eoetvoesiella caeni]
MTKEPRPLRIVHSEAATSFGGQEQYIYRMMHAMRDRGHHLEAICQPHAILAQRLSDDGFTVHTLLMDGPANFVKGVIKLRKVLKAGRFDVLNTHSRRDTMLAGCAGRLAGTPLIVRTRHLAKRVGSLLSFTVIPHRVTTSSDYVRKLLIERGVRPSDVATVYPSIDLRQGVDPQALRQELRLAQNDIVIGCVAVMRAEKGHRALVDAVEPLIRQRPNLHLVLVGGGSPVFEQVQEQVQAKGLNKRVHLLGARKDVPELLAGFDIFALATEMEAAGMVFAEAASAGLPIVGTKVGGVPEMVQDGVTGLLVPLHDQPALTAALERLISDPALRIQMGEAGRRMIRVDGKFSGQAMAESIESCYERWLGELRK